MDDRVFTEVSVAGAPRVSFCVDPDAGDPVADWFLSHDWIDEPVQRAFLSIVEPGMRILDLGCHLGTFSLPAAALGASVLAVDAAASHVALLNAAATRNGFDELHALQRAISDSVGLVDFVERSIHGHVGLPGASPTPGAVRVAAATVDELLDERGWDSVDLIKMDIEGMEAAALGGMRRLHDRGLRPTIVFECNATMLERAGSSICALRARMVELGYELLLIDHLRPGTLVEATPAGIQPECVCDYLAVAPRPPQIAERWRIEAPFSREEALSRLLDTAAGEGVGYRAYGASVFIDGPPWLREAGEAGAVIGALRADLDAAVRNAADACRPSAALEHTAEDPPRLGGRPDDMVVWARGLWLRRGREELERAPGDEPDRAHELLLEDACFHVRSGQLVCVHSDDPESASALLRVLGGREAPFVGEAQCGAPAVLLARLGDGFEDTLTVGENIAVFAAFLGADVTQAERRSGDVASIAGLHDRIGVPLHELRAAEVAGLALTVALEFAAPRLLLVDRISAVESEQVRSWLTARTWQLRGRGGAVVQVLTEARARLGPVDRMLWISQRKVVSNGHADSVLEAAARARLGLGREHVTMAV